MSVTKVTRYGPESKGALYLRSVVPSDIIENYGIDEECTFNWWSEKDHIVVKIFNSKGDRLHGR